MDTANEWTPGGTGLVLILETPWGPDAYHATICPLNPAWSADVALRLLGTPQVWTYVTQSAYAAREAHMALEPRPAPVHPRPERWQLGYTQIRNGTAVLVPLYVLEAPDAPRS
jgi:hypothetical protein